MKQIIMKYACMIMFFHSVAGCGPTICPSPDMQAFVVESGNTNGWDFFIPAQADAFVVRLRGGGMARDEKVEWSAQIFDSNGDLLKTRSGTTTVNAEDREGVKISGNFIVLQDKDILNRQGIKVVVTAKVDRRRICSREHEVIEEFTW